MLLSRLRSALVYMLFRALAMLLTLLLFFAVRRLFFSSRQQPAGVPVSSHPFSLRQPASAQPQFALNGTPEKKSSTGRRILIVASALALIALIAVSFLFSIRYYSGTLAQAKTTATGTHPPVLVRPAFERGVIYPQWSQNGYGVQDTTWQQDVSTMKTQTGAQWIEIPVLFSQATSSSTTVEVSPSTPDVQSFTQGIERAHALGYHVFFVPLMQVRQPDGWSGSITFTTNTQEQEWFDSYWHTLQPYIAAAAQQHVEQMAIGTELQTLQQTVPAPLWNQLMIRIRGTFNGTLTYDMNWSSLGQPMPDWLKNPTLTYIGVSEYIPLLTSPARIDPAAMPALWQQKVKTQLDALASALGKPVLITEIGYRNSSDALYHTWEATSKAQADPAEQAGAYNAALSNALKDTHIAGTFFWGWNDVGMFAIAGQPAVQVLHKWYTLTQA
ncbi:MAG TPA: hypothetical protein VKV40_11900 [Ktedonobacteraceae bacterium]|nr:hypothetical protein [Ktedonobacteraceae bacterium]